MPSAGELEDALAEIRLGIESRHGDDEYQTTTLAALETAVDRFMLQSSDANVAAAAQEALAAIATPWAVRLLRRLTAADGLDSDEREGLIDRVAALSAALCGRGGAGPRRRTWRFEASDGDFLEVNLRELDLVSGGLGGQTWGSGHVLARLLVSRPELWRPRCSGPKACILELGSGTGLAGLFCAAVLARSDAPVTVELSDYQPALVDNLVRNIADNSLGHVASASVLDWSQAATQRPRDASVILAADVVYDPDHASAIALAVDRHLSRRSAPRDIAPALIIVAPLREHFDSELAAFRGAMQPLFDLMLVRRVSDSSQAGGSHPHTCLLLVYIRT